MRSIILLSALLFACRGDTDDSSDGVDSDTFRPAIDESPEPDRVGTYAHTLPESPKTVIFLGDSITAGAGAWSDEEDYASLLVNNPNAWSEWDGMNRSCSFSPGWNLAPMSKVRTRA